MAPDEDVTDLCQELVDRMEGYRATGDVRHVVGDSALDTASRLAEALPGHSSVGLGLLMTLIPFHLLRARLGAGPQAELDAERAAAHRQRLQEEYGITFVEDGDDDFDPESTLVVNLDEPEPEDEDEGVDDEIIRLWNLFMLTGDTRLLVHVVDLLRHVVQDTAPDDPLLVERVAKLGTATGRLAAVTHDAALSDDAVALLDLAVRLEPDNARNLDRLGVQLQQNVEQTGRWEHLDRAVAVSLAAVKATATLSPDYPVRLGNHCAALWTRGRYANHVESFDDAIRLLPLVLDHPYLDPSLRAGHRTNLGNALRDRGQLVGDRHAMSEAILVQEQALAEMADNPTPYVNTIGVRMNHASTLLLWHKHTHHPDALTDGIGLLLDCLNEAGPDHPMRPMLLCDLGNALDQADEGDIRTRLESADVFREAIDLLPPGHPVAPLVRSNLVATLLPTEIPPDGMPAEVVAEAMRHAEQAVNMTTRDDPEAGHRLNHLGLAHRHRHRLSGDPDDLSAAVRAYRASALLETAPLWVRWNSYEAWGEAAALAGDWAGALAGFGGIAALLPLAVGELTSRRNREMQLMRLGSGIRDAAACALRLDRPEEAVRLLEEGRGVLLRQLVEQRTAIDDLQERAPDLADEYRQLREVLGSASASRIDADHGLTLARQRAAHRLTRLTEEIRQRPGLSTFPRRLAPDPSAAAADGPVAVVNISRYRSDALAVTGHGIVVVPLPDATPEAVSARVSALYEALDRRSAARGDAAARRRVEADVEEVLAWLWDAVVGPVLARLSLDRAAEPGARPALWWSPTGELTLLPLHAAQRRGTADAARLCALDCVVSSYTPTLRTLTPSAPASARRPMIVAMPHTEGYGDLPGTEDEAGRVRALLGGGQLLVGAEATREAVLGALSTATHAHFACHAVCRPQDPSRSGLMTADGPLTLAELAGLTPEGAELVYLSACETARGGDVLTDEAVHLCATLRLAGFRHAVGTLWPIGDQVAVYTTDAFYRALVGNKGSEASPRVVVNEVSSRLRNEHPDLPTRWATLIHVGG
ncbi:CHAT domain-containing tetratricopeptide repeat protein [Streptomyces justiciae]|uniref:CHAT domain-containing protein n=1 Tax=Streptomyces justiciae TaxID=2780140 RepID=A0ABU3LX77_9ACTN|nr:CHAT domain-containing protein [Streptomyces justiciae]MDT7843153.1 CHAT domain-containing protein [Streptomyces justiciae]